jgi:hypothetical protein
MLTWALGLMGAGIFPSKDFLAAAPPGLRFAALLPWIAGIICAIGGRLLWSELMPLDDLHHYDRVHRMEMLLLLADEEQIRSGIDAVLRDEGGLKEKGADIKRRLRDTNACFHGAHIFLALGIVAVVVVAYCTSK